jgi:hypothetical protein
MYGIDMISADARFQRCGRSQILLAGQDNCFPVQKTQADTVGGKNEAQAAVQKEPLAVLDKIPGEPVGSLCESPVYSREMAVDDALWLACAPGGINDLEWVGPLQRINHF